MTTLLLIRHATNDWVSGHLAGWTPGVHLNQQGQEQARTLAHNLQPIPITALYSSPLERALETAQPIAQTHNLTITTVEGIGEIHYGEWNGANIKELTNHELWPGIQHYPSDTRIPGGETLGEAQIRAITTINHLRANHQHNDIIAIVTHADMIKLATAYYIGMHIDLFQRLTISPASVTAIAFETMGPRLLTCNHTGTLHQLQPPPPEQHHQK